MISKSSSLAMLASLSLSLAVAVPPSGSNITTTSPPHRGETTLSTVTVTPEPVTVTAAPATVTVEPSPPTPTATSPCILDPVPGHGCLNNTGSALYTDPTSGNPVPVIPPPKIIWPWEKPDDHPWLPHPGNSMLQGLKPGFDCFPAGYQPNGLDADDALVTKCDMSTDVAEGQCWCYPTPKPKRTTLPPQ